MRDEGVIKFQCHWTKSSPPEHPGISELIRYRQMLFELGLVGVYPDGIGYGNVSIRGQEPGQFLISATQTGHLALVDPSHFVTVTAFNIDQNQVTCVGSREASSESLTHAMIYDTFPEANAVIHVHAADAWKSLLGKLPTSAKDVAYGTPAMAAEIRRLSTEADLSAKKVLIMAGHDEGIISFGTDLSDAWNVLAQSLQDEHMVGMH